MGGSDSTLGLDPKFFGQIIYFVAKWRTVPNTNVRYDSESNC